MRCLHCSKKIGWIRQLVDRQFCSKAHRKLADKGMYSARVVRDLENQESFEDGWLISVNAPKKRPAGLSAGSGIMLILAATMLVLFLPGGEQRPLPSVSYLPPVGSIGEKLAKTLPGGSLRLREDFSRDLRNWQGDAKGEKNDGWSKAGDTVNIGDLRLWKPTLTLSDYNVHFEAQIENRAMGWAFRAPNLHNYYATKIHISRVKGEDAFRAEIVRYVVLNGKETGKVRLPLPLTFSEDTVYDVRVRVSGDRFNTLLNGRLVDSWTDKRLKRGGFGFFAENGEKAHLRYVALSERESFLDRFLSFSFLIGPFDPRMTAR